MVEWMVVRVDATKLPLGSIYTTGCRNCESFEDLEKIDTTVWKCKSCGYTEDEVLNYPKYKHCLTEDEAKYVISEEGVYK